MYSNGKGLKVGAEAIKAPAARGSYTGSGREQTPPRTTYTGDRRPAGFTPTITVPALGATTAAAVESHCGPFFYTVMHGLRWRPPRSNVMPPSAAAWCYLLLLLLLLL